MSVRQTNFEAIGTRWTIQTAHKMGDAEWDELLLAIHKRIEAFDITYSRFRSDSLITKMAHHAGTYDLPADSIKLLAFYRQLYDGTDGRVTPLIGMTMESAGYDATYSLKPKELVRPPKWDEVIEQTGTQIIVKKPVLLDFGAAGKGYLVDIVAELLKDAGRTAFTINAGGDLVHRGEHDEQIEIGLENPLDTSQAVGIAHLSNASLCASAGSRRVWDEYHHIIDPISLQSPTEVIATWVVADDTMTADGLATALFFVPAQQLRRVQGFSYAILYRDMSLEHSNDFPATIFSEAA